MRFSRIRITGKSMTNSDMPVSLGRVDSVVASARTSTSAKHYARSCVTSAVVVAAVVRSSTKYSALVGEVDVEVDVSMRAERICVYVSS